MIRLRQGYGVTGAMLLCGYTTLGDIANDEYRMEVRDFKGEKRAA